MTPSIYEFPRLEISSPTGRVRAQIIGKSALAKKFQLLLRNQEIVSEIVDAPAAINLSRPADFVFWLLMHNSRKIPEVLANYLKSSRAKLVIISEEPITNEFDELLTKTLDAGIDACLVFLQDVYGPRVGDSPLSLIWRDLKSKFVINLPDDDNAEIYPIYLDDAAAAIIKISFSAQTYGRTFYISGVDKITVLSFSYRLREEVVRQAQKLPPINYIQTNLSPLFTVHDSLFTNDAAATRAFLSWQPETDLSEGLSKLVASLNPSRPERAEDGVSEIIEEEPDKISVSLLTGRRRRVERGFLAERIEETPSRIAPERKHLKKKTTIHFRRAFVFPLVLATLFAAAILSPPRLLDRLAASLAGNSPARLARLEPVFVLLGRRERFQQLEQSAAFNQSKTEIAGLAGQLLQSIFTDSSVSQSAILDELESRSTALLLTPLSAKWRPHLGLARELIPVARLALEGDRKKTFLIVFQNSAEIRPSGGFISSLAFVTIQKGKLLDIDYQSVYQLDSQLVGVEPPPAPIKDRLGETNWLIRDANWAADGRLSAQKIENLIERATSRRIDGTIMLTTPALQSILAKTGEIAGSDGSVWNQLNIVERLVYSDRADPQTGQRNDPLVSVAKALEEFVKTNPNRHRVIAAALSAIGQNNLLITSSDSSLAQVLKTLWADGSLPETACLPAACLSDQISIVDANLGANKADYFMIKEHDIGISLTDNQSSSAVTLRYYNSASSSQYPAGTYRNYVRVYLPADSIITSVVRLAPDGLVAVPTDNSIESGRKVIGWYMEIPSGGQEVFRLESVRQAKLTLQNQTAAYSLTVRKQPGTAIPVSVSVGFPPNLAPLTVSENVTVAGNKLLHNHDGETNLSFTAEFASN